MSETFHSIDQQTFAKQNRDRLWLAPPQPFRETDLEPYYRELDLAVLELSRRTRVPYSLLTQRPRPRLRDRLWSRSRTARRLLFRAFRR